VSRLRLTPQVLERFIFVLWSFHTLSATVGVLQVYDPDRFQMRVSKTIAGDEMREGAVQIVLANGRKVFRPMGLSDSPGGAAASGLYAIIFGLGLLFQRRSFVLSVAGVTSMSVGLFCIYICQIRSLLVMSGVATVT